jgi:hypothetical protein
MERTEIQAMGAWVSEDEIDWTGIPLEGLEDWCSMDRKSGKVLTCRSMGCKFVDRNTDVYSSRLMSYLV